ncbi:MAG: hypothetical protein AMJ54_16875, partial [Deltaproteobacteria bacterium SG8_13]
MTASIITWLAWVLLVPPAAQAVVPAADFTATPQSGVVPLQVQFTDLSTGDVTSWSWDFNGDSVEDSVDQHPLVTYSAPGTYSVTLTATGPDGADSLTKADLIVVDQPLPLADFAATPLSGVAPLPVQFTDQSTGDVTSWSWDLDGDSIQDSTVQHPSFTYATPGTYSVTLTVTDPGGTSSKTETDLIVVTYPPPVAQFIADPSEGTKPLTVSFTNESLGEITGYAWHFDADGIPDSFADNPVHTFADSGTYTVRLVATGPGGEDEEVKTDYITVTEPAPVAGFVSDVTSGFAPLLVTFMDTSDGVRTQWSWDLDGDGQPDSDLQNPAFTYVAAGTYTVSLTVTGPGGSDTATVVDYVTVTDPPP